MKKYGLILAILLLSGCGVDRLDVNQKAIDRTSLGVTTAPPLTLDGLSWHVTNNSVCTSVNGYINLSNDMEKVQNRLNEDEQKIKLQKQYYENTKK